MLSGLCASIVRFKTSPPRVVIPPFLNRENFLHLPAILVGACPCFPSCERRISCGRDTIWFSHRDSPSSFPHPCTTSSSISSGAFRVCGPHRLVSGLPVPQFTDRILGQCIPPSRSCSGTAVLSFSSDARHSSDPLSPQVHRATPGLPIYVPDPCPLCCLPRS